jgi:hypothetical protein
VIGDPRRQSTGRFCPRDVVAEIEDVVDVVSEDEKEDGRELAHEIESAVARARRSRSVSMRSILQFFFMAAPKILRGAFQKPRI